MKLAPKEEAASEPVIPVKPVEPVDPSGNLADFYALIMKAGLRWLLEDLPGSVGRASFNRIINSAALGSNPGRDIRWWE